MYAMCLEIKHSLFSLHMRNPIVVNVHMITNALSTMPHSMCRYSFHLTRGNEDIDCGDYHRLLSEKWG